MCSLPMILSIWYLSMLECIHISYKVSIKIKLIEKGNLYFEYCSLLTNLEHRTVKIYVEM